MDQGVKNRCILVLNTQAFGFAVPGISVPIYLNLSYNLNILVLMYNSMQVLCTLGSVVFVSILLIRGLWSGVSFLQESRHQQMDQLDMHNAWNGGQAVI